MRITLNKAFNRPAAVHNAPGMGRGDAQGSLLPDMCAHWRQPAVASIFRQRFTGDTDNGFLTGVTMGQMFTAAGKICIPSSSSSIGSAC